MTLPRFLLALAIFVLASCASVPRLTKQALNDAEQQFLQANYTEAARMFTALSAQASANLRTELRLRAASAMAKANLIPQARATINDVEIDKSNPHQVFLYMVAEAHLALTERRPNEVFTFLKQAPPRNTKKIYHAEYFKIRADAYTMLGNRLETASSLVNREKFLSDADIITNNQRAIWDALTTMSPRALQQLRTAPPPDTLSGWMHLVQIAKSFQLDPVKLKDELERWKKYYPNHPASDDILRGLSSRSIDDVTHPRRIALILPLSSKFATAAEAVRDGFLAAYYSTLGHKVESIKIYDVGDNPDSVTDVYDQAISDGAQFVVGPLDKNSVSKLLDQEPLPVPTLALNYALEPNETPKNLFQFGLSPEEEAKQVAERTWLDGHVNAATIIPNGPWGERVAQAFKERWELMGGKIVASQNYDPTKRLYSSAKHLTRYR